MGIEKIAGGVTAASGFKAAGYAAGIKKNGAADMAMIYSDSVCTVAGTFTTNVVKAAPVLWDRELVSHGLGQVVVINSGVANACTGREGMICCEETAEAAQEALGVKSDHVFVASTGVIGRQLPMDKIRTGTIRLAGLLGSSPQHGLDAAKAMMTTDTIPKEAAAAVTLPDGSRVVVGGCAKGSGMIHPNMCTMLSFITTDAAISAGALQKALSQVVPETFNMVSVDGDTSTNDTCLVLANGAAGNPEITEEGEAFRLFAEALLSVCTELARMMAKDGEGATCLFECRVIHASSKADAKILARSVVSSTLTKAAIAGHDANWGRILCALGYSGVLFNPDTVSLTLSSRAGSVLPFDMGVPKEVDEELATRVLSEDEVLALVDLHDGEAEAAAFGCDLTHEYVNINADYRS